MSQPPRAGAFRKHESAMNYGCCVKSLCRKQPVCLLEHHEQARQKSDRKGCERMHTQTEARNGIGKMFANHAAGREEPTYSSERVGVWRSWPTEAHPRRFRIKVDSSVHPGFSSFLNQDSLRQLLL